MKFSGLIVSSFLVQLAVATQKKTVGYQLGCADWWTGTSSLTFRGWIPPFLPAFFCQSTKCKLNLVWSKIKGGV